MSKCMICKKENDGAICRHCLTKGASKTGKVMKSGGKFLIKTIPVVLSIIPIVVTKGKFKPKS